MSVTNSDDFGAGTAPKGFRPGSRRRARIAAGLVVAALAVGGNVLLYSSLNQQIEVVQVAEPILAGERITAADLRVVESNGVPGGFVPANQIDSVIGQYAITFVGAGIILPPTYFQSTPLVGADVSHVSFGIDNALIPSRTRNRSLVELVLVGDDQANLDPAITTTDGADNPGGTETGIANVPGGSRAVQARIVAIDGRESDTDIAASVRVTVEVALADAAAVATAETIRIVLLDPGVDPAVEG